MTAKKPYIVEREISEDVSDCQNESEAGAESGLTPVHGWRWAVLFSRFDCLQNDFITSNPESVYA